MKRTLVGLIVLAGFVAAATSGPTWAQTMGYRRPPPVPSQAPAAVRAPRPPVSPRAGWIWIPGQWIWRQALRRYLWIRGYWTSRPGPGFVWVPGQWVWRPRRGIYVWVPGRWVERPLRKIWEPQHQRQSRNEWPRGRQGRRWD